jgi:hypothetical protein
LCAARVIRNGQWIWRLHGTVIWENTGVESDGVEEVREPIKVMVDAGLGMYALAWLLCGE